MANLKAKIESAAGKPVAECSNTELYNALAVCAMQAASEKRPAGEKAKKKVYYLSMEYLIGKLLSNNLINLGWYEEVQSLLSENGKSLAEIEEIEKEPSLGNGGLGRLAACFLDSMATLGLNGCGIGLHYHFGLFHQKFTEKKQEEVPDGWKQEGIVSWDPKPEDAHGYTVSFGNGSVRSEIYEIPVIGYEGCTIPLRLFDIESVDEGLVHGGIGFDQTETAKNLTLFLYPDDGNEAGKKLRVYQEYFMVSNAAQMILEECKERGSNLHDLPDYAVIQINDTHPSMMIPEMIRLMMEQGIAFDEAADIMAKICAYTNHTILAEALEKWPMSYLEEIVPQLVPVIRGLDARVKETYQQPETAIIDKDDTIHMAHLDIHYGFSVNGVAMLHTEILKHTQLAPFYAIYPEKFNNKTNGITFRRWLLCCNRPLAGWITGKIGDGWKKDAEELEALAVYAKDTDALTELLAIKQENKKQLREFLEKSQGIPIDDHSIYDIQIKRMHEYKRQLMNALHVIRMYLDIKEGNLPARPVTVIFGGKAAPAYVAAKDVIHLILCLADLINHDPQVSQHLKVVMVENYNVTKAEKLIPACDISEQISLASQEASGTGNMKLMLNGAVTIGTMDGANVEIAELVGSENIYIFGEDSQSVLDHYAKRDYCPMDYYQGNPKLQEVVDFLVSSQMLAVGDRENLSRLHHDLLHKDWYMALLDYEDYVRVRMQAYADYEDRMSWAKKMLANISHAGFFSSDRTIRQYNEEIWKL